MEFKKADHHTTAKALVAFLAIFIAALLFLVFQVNQDNIMMAGNFNNFMIAATIGMGSLIGIVYLANKTQDQPRKQAVKKKKKR